MAELDDLYRRFERLDRDRSGTLSVEEILGIPEFAMNPLAPRFIDILHLGAGEELDFPSFVQLLSVFHAKTKRLDKLKCTPHKGCPFIYLFLLQLPLKSTILPMTGLLRKRSSSKYYD